MLRCVTFLAPVFFPTYQAIVAYLARRVGQPIELEVGTSFDAFAAGAADLGFVCGLDYVRLTACQPESVELLAAPVAVAMRYCARPVYFSDVVVRQDSRFTRFADLRGATWVYNEQVSYSGYVAVARALSLQGETCAYFGRCLASGSHERSLQMVLDGMADATALDSHVLDLLLVARPELSQQIRIIASIGPATSPPVIAASRLDRGLKEALREALLSMHTEREHARILQESCLHCFAPVTDSSYDEIRSVYVQQEQ
ncbi:phosphonate transport system substrate-binding protein [Thermosporothrix hazakensis]|uniref:Phosphonate transport system substrate-binding protein n=3 Tax=Thermosporothrix TaxID=768650 RepID=A0A326UM30_THEHA|nr:phosphonate transport system substrate-binding protein [Thermosporothrix hazakensis]BBH85465.1 hypothetical protein KTC_02160 [Thermosporothrix sp. COM3]GCE46108.1 hypothetical protein KTH_09770 [Thermosporothrix hazakensis]